MLPMSSRPLLLFGLLLALFGAQGCAIGNQKRGRIIDHRQIAEIKVGTSTKQDVLDLFGPPTTYSRVGATVRGSATTASLLGRQVLDDQPAVEVRVDTKEPEDVFVYEYVEDDESFFTVLLFTWFRRDTLADRLMVFFDAKDTVKYMAFAKQTDADPADEDDED